MKSVCSVGSLALFSVLFASLAGAATLLLADEATTSKSISDGQEPTQTLTIGDARLKARVLHAAIHSTLRVVHDRYYREDQALPIPAAALGEVFQDIESTEHVKLRWLAVEGQAMNTDHLAQDAFEVDAANALKAGKPFHEEASEKIYRRAAPITLSNHCLKCHMPDRKSTRDRRAGLIITVPLQPVARH